jgi:hypothetical protein
MVQSWFKSNTFVQGDPMTAGYHNPRWFRTDAHQRWQAVGPDNRWLNTAMQGLITGLFDVVWVKSCGGTVTRVTRKRGKLYVFNLTPEQLEAMRNLDWKEVNIKHDANLRNIRTRYGIG